MQARRYFQIDYFVGSQYQNTSPYVKLKNLPYRHTFVFNFARTVMHLTIISFFASDKIRSSLETLQFSQDSRGN